MHAHAGPGGAYLMMRPLRQKAWYRQLSLRWQTDILQQLPKPTIAEMKRCAAAVLSFEAARSFCGSHPLIRSYNRHVVGVRYPLPPDYPAVPHLCRPS